MAYETTEYFILARALEHPDNGEDFDLRNKIMMAILRYDQNADFASSYCIESRIPFVFLERHTFNRERMGYDVLAYIKRGTSMLVSD